MKTVPAKTIITRNKHAAAWFGCDYNMNLYRGCCHGCLYCDSRSDCYQNPDFDTVKKKENALEIVRDELALNLRIADVFPVSRGVDFLGYRHFDNYILLRKSTAKRVRKRLSLLPGLYARGKISAEQFRSSVASTWGWLGRANSKNFRESVGMDALMEQVAAL